METVSGNIIDVLNGEIYKGTLKIKDGRIADIVRENVRDERFILPGFIDSHIHIESSMLPPSEFARVSVLNGTVAVVSDPHEIANVLGVEGIKYFIDNSKKVPLKFYFGAPSCVPASPFDSSGATLGPQEIEKLFQMNEIRYLGEVMNFPGVINRDPVLLKKLSIARKYSRKIDGHAPGLTGKDLELYINAGIDTDHECVSQEEALEKLNLGMKIQIREGSAARNGERLISLLEERYENCMFCSDDKHPDDLVKGQINDLVKMALDYGIDRMKVLRVACVNPVLHYGLDVGLLRKGDFADFIIIDDFKRLNILATYINGEKVSEENETLINGIKVETPNNFFVTQKEPGDLFIEHSTGRINVIGVNDRQIITEKLLLNPGRKGHYAIPDPSRDILKIVVINRYGTGDIGKGFVKGFGLKKGAIASSIAHDSHNIIALGVDDETICRAVNTIIRAKGGISAVSGERESILALPLAGIMSDMDYVSVADQYLELNRAAQSFGSPLSSPFMTLSFMALLVIPRLKISDRGLFDGEKFGFVH
ncbi:MAG: adenine deaminase [Deltaproteobacteria bacterium]|nr:adenine deaminase [Deltaproteobacteria bacterium]